jgi:hypothetical protein
MSKCGYGIVIKRMGENHDGNWKCNECSFNHASADKVFAHMRKDHSIFSRTDLNKAKRLSKKRITFPIDPFAYSGLSEEERNIIQEKIKCLLIKS